VSTFMRELDEEFRLSSGLTERRYYKIFYSKIHAFPILVLGQNPGGETDGTDLVASESYFENWEHDYVDFRNHPEYRLAGPMCELLEYALQTTSDDVLRRIPATNVAFRRSRNTDTLTTGVRASALETQSALSKIIQEVNPNLVLLISKTAYDWFVKIHCRRGTLVERLESRVFTPNGGNMACIFAEASAEVSVLGRQVKLVMVGHPSKYSPRSEWSEVLANTRQVFATQGLSPFILK